MGELNKENQKIDVQLPVTFELGEAVEMKGWYFKIVLVDAFTNKICLKRISKEEAMNAGKEPVEPCKE